MFSSIFFIEVKGSMFLMLFHHDWTVFRLNVCVNIGPDFCNPVLVTASGQSANFDRGGRRRLYANLHFYTAFFGLWSSPNNLLHTSIILFLETCSFCLHHGPKVQILMESHNDCSFFMTHDMPRCKK